MLDMPKIPEHYEDYIAPWEKEGAGELDPEKVKKLLYNVQRENEANATERALLKQQLDEASQKLTAKDDEVRQAAQAGETEVQALQRQFSELQKTMESERKSTAKETALLKVQRDLKLSDAQAAFISGENYDELKASAERLIETFGVNNTKPAENLDANSMVMGGATASSSGGASSIPPYSEDNLAKVLAQFS